MGAASGITPRPDHGSQSHHEQERHAGGQEQPDPEAGRPAPEPVGDVPSLVTPGSVSEIDIDRTRVNSHTLSRFVEASTTVSALQTFPFGAVAAAAGGRLPTLRPAGMLPSRLLSVNGSRHPRPRCRGALRPELVCAVGEGRWMDGGRLPRRSSRDSGLSTPTGETLV